MIGQFPASTIQNDPDSFRTDVIGQFPASTIQNDPDSFRTDVIGQFPASTIQNDPVQLAINWIIQPTSTCTGTGHCTPKHGSATAETTEAVSPR